MDKPIKLGLAGLGTAGRAFLPAIRKHAGFDLVAVAEPAEEPRAEIIAEDHVAGYASLSQMLAHPDLDAVLIGTPTNMHPDHVAAAAAAGKHVLVEKPMAIEIAEAKAMVRRADESGKVLLVGHSHSYDMPIREMRNVIASGELGRVRMVNTWNYTDWVYRPRRPDELLLSEGGGVTFRQGSHQFDIIRYLVGSKAKSLRAKTFDWDPNRSVVGAHTVWLEFEDGASATAVYNGYGGFSAMELCFDVTEWGFIETPEQRKPVKRSGGASAEELAAKRARSKNAIPAEAPNQPFFGLTLVSCEKGDIRQSPKGLIIYSEAGRRQIDLATDILPRDFVMAEFHDAITGKAKPVHDGRWGLANLEICRAALESSVTCREITLENQVGLP
jgi:phthalate 4,5-cis-dihydrodiol dehydrogenase